jgi:hypothetical protein
MAYFLILPAFLLYVAVCLCAIGVTSVVESLKPHRPVLVSVFGWSSFGFFAANLLYGIARATLVAVEPSLPTTSATLTTALGIAFMVVIPFAASIVGLVGGGIYGFRRAADSRQGESH